MELSKRREREITADVAGRVRGRGQQEPPRLQNLAQSWQETQEGASPRQRTVLSATLAVVEALANQSFAGLAQNRERPPLPMPTSDLPSPAISRRTEDEVHAVTLF